MIKVFLALTLAFLTTSSSAYAQSTPGAPANPPPQGGIMAASNSLKILSPMVDEKVGSSSVSIRYQITDSGAAAASSPTFRVQLDARDPSETLDTESNFTGLTPGAHVVTVELVDANHNPIGGSRVIVHFTTFNPGAAAQKPQTTGALSPPVIIKANLPLPERGPTDQLPTAGGELPLLSLVGFGVLVGGVISAMRTRK